MSFNIRNTEENNSSSSNNNKKPKSQYKFISKLIDIVSNSSLENIVKWNENGDIIEIIDEKKFINEILPLYFKHNNFQNFIRQLNMYGFKKVKNYNKDVIPYSNPYFRRNCYSLINEINRKNTGSNFFQYEEKEESSQKKDVEYYEKESEKDEPMKNFKEEKDEKILNKKINFLYKKLMDMDERIVNLEKINSVLINNNSCFLFDIKNKSLYIDRLEALVFYLVNFLLPKAIVLENEGSDDNSNTYENEKNRFFPEKDLENYKKDNIESIDKYKINPNHELIKLYKHISKDYKSNEIESLPETKKILNRLKINEYQDVEKEENQEYKENSFKSINSINHSKSLLNQRNNSNQENGILEKTEKTECEKFFEKILDKFKGFCRNRSIKRYNNQINKQKNNRDEYINDNKDNIYNVNSIDNPKLIRLSNEFNDFNEFEISFLNRKKRNIFDDENSNDKNFIASKFFSFDNYDTDNKKDENDVLDECYIQYFNNIK